MNEALEQMVRVGRYKCLIINKDNELLGIITVMDLLGEVEINLDEPAIKAASAK